MAGEAIIPKQGVGRTFCAATWMLGVVAVLQAAAVAVAIVKRMDLQPAGGEAEDRPPEVAPAITDAEGGTVDLQAAAMADAAGAILTGGRGPDGELLHTMAVAPQLPIETGSWPQPGNALAIKDPKVIELMEAGASLRERGDLPGALARLREADALSPGHPGILYEIADCFNAMGLREKAVPEWEKILDMGVERAGDYWLIADLNLRGESSGESPSDRSALTVSRILVQRHPEVTDGEKVTLRIALKARAGVEVVPSEVVVNVFFFDLVNGSSIARTTADQPRYQWATLPIDWKEHPEEILDVEYFHPVLTQEQVRDLGERRYHGHIVEVYYRDELQDVVAQPRTLRSLAPEAVNPLMQNRLFPAK